MKNKINTVLLLDDNAATNFINKKFITEADCAEKVLDFRSGKNALNYLNSNDVEAPELIFIDINMPIMDAWEFLEEYKQIEIKKKVKSVIVLLSTSLSPADKIKIEKINIIDDMRLKPLSIESVNEVIKQFFPTDKAVI